MSVTLPKGAMQFAFNPGWTFAPWIWVSGPEKRGMYISDCDCKVVFHVLKKFMPKAMIEANKDLLHLNMCVCLCSGRIIE